MTIANISSQSALGSTGPQTSSRLADFRNLAKALSSGDLAAAQQAFASLEPSTSAPKTSGPASSDLDALGSALQSGDLAGAQKAFSNLQATAKKGHGHHHHGHGGAPQADPSQTDPSQPATTNGILNIAA